MTIGQRLTALRRANGLSRTAVARLMYLTAAEIRAFEEDWVAPTDAEWMLLRQLLPPASRRRVPRTVVVACCGDGCQAKREVPRARFVRLNSSGRHEGPCVENALLKLGWSERTEVRLVHGARQRVFLGWLCPACTAFTAEVATERERERVAAKARRKRELEQNAERARRKRLLRELARDA